MHDVTDHQLGGIVVRGAVLGVVSFFLVTMAIGLLAGVSLIDSAGIAIVPTLFGGWVYGAIACLLWAGFKANRAHDEPSSLLNRAPSSQEDHSRRAA